MAKTSNPRKTTKAISRTRRSHRPQSKEKEKEEKHPQQLPSWAVMKSIFTCKHLEVAQQQQQKLVQSQTQNEKQLKQTEKPSMEENSIKKSKKMKCSGSLCNNTKVTQRPEPPSSEILQRKNRATPANSSSSSSFSSSSHNGSNRSLKSPVLSEISSNSSNNQSSNSNKNGVLMKSSSSSNANTSIKGMPFRRLSGCYECRMVVDPVLAFTRDPSLRSTICSCPDCGEIFMKPENLELHQAVRHAVSELGPEDTSKNIVEIIFQSSWLRKQTPVCQIDRILKVHNTQKTINKFEEYRDSIKSKATKLTKKHPRCIADGNELLRFHCTTLMCSLGINGSSNLCNSIPHCNICSIIKSGFKRAGASEGILTTATSGLAHDRAEVAPVPGESERRAMLVCRVIAGRVKKIPDVGGGSGSGSEECDSVARATGVYSNLDELYVFNPKAILPCFVVIYKGF